MKHMKPISKRPNMAIDVSGWPVDITFLIDMMEAFVQKKSDLGVS